MQIGENQQISPIVRVGAIEDTPCNRSVDQGSQPGIEHRFAPPDVEHLPDGTATGIVRRDLGDEALRSRTVRVAVSDGQSCQVTEERGACAQ